MSYSKITKSELIFKSNPRNWNILHVKTDMDVQLTISAFSYQSQANLNYLPTEGHLFQHDDTVIDWSLPQHCCTHFTAARKHYHPSLHLGRSLKNPSVVQCLTPCTKEGEGSRSALRSLVQHAPACCSSNPGMPNGIPICCYRWF